MFVVGLAALLASLVEATHHDSITRSEVRWKGQNRFCNSTSIASEPSRSFQSQSVEMPAVTSKAVADGFTETLIRASKSAVASSTVVFQVTRISNLGTSLSPSDVKIVVTPPVQHPISLSDLGSIEAFNPKSSRASVTETSFSEDTALESSVLRPMSTGTTSLEDQLTEWSQVQVVSSAYQVLSSLLPLGGQLSTWSYAQSATLSDQISRNHFVSR